MSQLKPKVNVPLTDKLKKILSRAASLIDKYEREIK